MVRPADSSDCAAIATIENYAVETNFAHFGTSPVSPEATAQAFELAENRFPWFVKEIDGKVVGFARAGTWKVREGYHWTTEVGVYLNPEAQGRGFGRELYEALFPRLEEIGFHAIVAGIALPNEPSVRLHEAMGMHHVGTFPEMGFKLGAWRDVGYWFRNFDSPEPLI
jgi:phosphinothricin acetyltransferase